MPKLLTYEDLKTLGIRVSKAQISRLIREGRFPLAMRLSGPTSAPLWPEDEIRDWIKAKLDARHGEAA